ncbi:hypothetical protein [Sulfitobacter brevis]|uniref:hypothetical protein n=1 Tax=Sulfitobacter brevis TaxID=74348 RepID=UPI000B897C45|nr:hypothetical protein [Sulfitobacter brevis]
MAAAGDEPEDITPQTHLGLKAANAAKDKRAKDDHADRPKQSCVESMERYDVIETLVEARLKTKLQNDEIWVPWLLRRDLEPLDSRKDALLAAAAMLVAVNSAGLSEGAMRGLRSAGSSPQRTDRARSLVRWIL